MSFEPIEFPYYPSICPRELVSVDWKTKDYIS